MKRVPNAKEGRESVDFEIYGINGIPEEALVERAAKKARIAEANGEEVVVAKQEKSHEASAPGQSSHLGQQTSQQYGGQPHMPGMMYGRPIATSMAFHPMGQPGFPGIVGGPRPSFNPMQHGMSHMPGPPIPPPMFGGPQGPNGPFQGIYGAPGGPPQGYSAAAGVPQGAVPHVAPPQGSLPPGHKPPPGPPPGIAATQNGSNSGGTTTGVSTPLVTPLFPAGASTASGKRVVSN